MEIRAEFNELRAEFNALRSEVHDMNGRLGRVEGLLRLSAKDDEKIGDGLARFDIDTLRPFQPVICTRCLTSRVQVRCPRRSIQIPST